MLDWNIIRDSGQVRGVPGVSYISCGVIGWERDWVSRMHSFRRSGKILSRVKDKVSARIAEGKD
jgi:hypothetical protein